MNKQLRILVVSHGHPELSPGGGENVAYGLFKDFQSRPNCQAFFLAVLRDNNTPHPGSHFAPYNDKINEVLFYPGMPQNFLFSQIGTISKEKIWSDFRRFIEKIKPDIIHFHHYFTLGFEFIRELHNYSKNTQIILTLHEYLAICHRDGQMIKADSQKLCYYSSPADCHRCFPEISPANFKRRELYIKSFFELVDCFISPSYFLSDRYRQWGLPAEKLIFIENGQPPIEPASPRQVKPGEARNRFAYFGQVNPYKGLEVLLDALTYLPTNSEITIDIYGGNLEKQSPDYQEKLQKKIRQAGQFAQFYGSYRHEELANLMAQVDWVIVPSIWWENSPLVIQEAFSHRRPVICSNIGGMAEKVKPYQSGLHFQVGNARDLADRLVEAATTPGLWESLRDQIVPPPTVTQIGDRHLEVYQQLLIHNS